MFAQKFDEELRLPAGVSLRAEPEKFQRERREARIRSPMVNEIQSFLGGLDRLGNPSPFLWVLAGGAKAAGGDEA